MRTLGRKLTIALALALATLATAAPAWAQAARAGVVSTLRGTATVARVSLPEPEPLKFRDSVFVRDRITTGDDSLVRMMLGGRAMVTLRERTAVTLTEAPAAATINVPSGRVMIGVARSLMKPGEKVEVVTPNLVAAIRGTAIVVEVTTVAAGVRSTVTVLHGLIDVTRYDAGAAVTVGPPVPVADLQQVIVTSDEPVPAPRTLTPETAHALSDGFSVMPARAQHAVSATDAMVEQSLQDATNLLSLTTGDSAPGSQRLQAGGAGPVVIGTVAGVGGAVSGVGGAVGGTLGGVGGAVGGVGGALGGVGGGTVQVPPIVPHLLR